MKTYTVYAIGMVRDAESGSDAVDIARNLLGHTGTCLASTKASDCISYDDIDTISERIEGLRQARQEAADDEQRGYMRAPYDTDDPRRAAYMTERNRLRVSAGKSALKIREPRTSQ